MASDFTAGRFGVSTCSRSAATGMQDGIDFINALAFHMTVYRRVTAWDMSPVTPPAARERRRDTAAMRLQPHAARR